METENWAFPHWNFLFLHDFFIIFFINLCVTHHTKNDFFTKESPVSIHPLYLNSCWLPKEASILCKRLFALEAKRANILLQILAFNFREWASSHKHAPDEQPEWIFGSRVVAAAKNKRICASRDVCIKIPVTGQANIFNLQAKHDFLGCKACTRRWKGKEFLRSLVHHYFRFV